MAFQASVLALEAMNNGHFSLALGHFTTAIECEPSNSVGYVNRASLHSRMGNFHSTLEDSIAAINIDQASVKAHYYKAYALFQLERIDEAIECINSALLLEPSNEELQALHTRLKQPSRSPPLISRNGKTVASVSNIGCSCPPSLVKLHKNCKENDTPNAAFIYKDTIPPKPKDAIRIVCLSDTHSKQENIQVPAGDILIHAGDFTKIGKKTEVGDFSNWLSRQPHRHKIVIAGNHEVTFEPTFYETQFKRFHARDKQDPAESKAALKNCLYLEDEEVEVEGLKIYGSPWQPVFHNWAFNLERGSSIKEKWDKIPNNIDILVTHGPPKFHGGVTFDGEDVGCEDLLQVIQKRVKPLIHIFGHIHEGYGATLDENTVYINAANCTVDYRTINKPIVIDVLIDR